MWFIKSSPWFAGLSESQCQSLEKAARNLQLKRGCSLALSGDHNRCVYLVIRGRLRVTTLTPQGKQAILGYVEPGELFGENALLGEPRTADRTEAVEDSLIARIPTELVQRVMQESPETTLAITKLIGMRFSRLERRLRSLLFRSNRERLLHLLLDLSQQYGIPRTQGLEIRITFSHQELANLIGSTRESVTLLMSELEAQGLVLTTKRKISLLDCQSMERELQGQVDCKKSTRSVESIPKQSALVFSPSKATR